ncbi:MAG: MBL fold metallo-hydrolase [Candidatus Thorarchaeota archaeon]|nr:MAG: MBL fold metallo-hydrolase [Candidatus Thorarchaeota archaeon]
MLGSRNSKIPLVVVVGAIVISVPLLMMMMQPAQEPPTEITMKLLNNAGVMIEVDGVRIYIDPLYIPSNYTELPADVILITHDHTDHYSPSDIEDIFTNDTLFICPANMTQAIDRFNGTGVNPGDSIMFGDINITAFYLYLPDYSSGLPTFHPRAANWTSFLIEIDGFTIYHAGDNKYIPEYEELTGTIDVAFLPIYFDPGLGPLNESLLPIVDAIDMIQPRVVIPTHFTDPNREIFMTEYSILVENTITEILNLPYFTTMVYETT